LNSWTLSGHIVAVGTDPERASGSWTAALSLLHSQSSVGNEKRGAINSAGTIMIKNGLYAVTSQLLDGLEGGAKGVSVLQDGIMRGGGSIYYHTGSYTRAGGKWKGAITTREHEPDLITRLFARKVVTMGFTGT